MKDLCQTLVDPRRVLDFAILKTLTPNEVYKLLVRASELGVRAVSTYFSLMRDFKHSFERIRFAVVIDFPHGSSHLESKIKAVEQSIAHGADEIEFVVNLYKLSKGDIDYVLNEVRALSSIARATNVTSRMIVDTSIVDVNIIAKLLEAIVRLPPEERPDYIKFNTGFFRAPSINEIITLTMLAKKHGFKVKVSGGIRHYSQVLILVKLIGADLVGSSAAEDIINEYRELKRYCEDQLRQVSS